MTSANLGKSSFCDKEGSTARGFTDAHKGRGEPTFYSSCDWASWLAA